MALGSQSTGRTAWAGGANKRCPEEERERPQPQFQGRLQGGGVVGLVEGSVACRRERPAQEAASEAWLRISSAGAEGLEKGETGELKIGTTMGVVGEMECRDKEAGFYTGNNGKPLKVFTIGGGIGDEGADVDLKIILEATWGLLFRAERQGSHSLLSPPEIPPQLVLLARPSQQSLERRSGICGTEGTSVWGLADIGSTLGQGFCPQ